MFCGFCERFACEHFAKASPQTIILPVALKNPDYELRTGCHVLRVNLDSTGKKATGVTYIDSAGREFEQPAELVLVTAYSLSNVRMLLTSRIGQDVVINPFMASGASGTVIDDFAGDNFDHKGLGFVGGGYISATMTGGRPIEFHPTPPGTPS